MQTRPCKFLTSPMLAVVTAAISKDGIWTGHDWKDNADGVEDHDGVLTAFHDLLIQKMNSTKTYEGDDLESVYLDQPNVQMVQSVLTEKQWNYLFPMANELYDYHSFLKASATFTAFCLEGDADLCKRELATFFAMTTHETGY